MNEWQKPKAKPWLRIVAFLTALVFTVTNVSWAGGTGSASSISLDKKPSEPAANELFQRSKNPSDFFESLAVPDSIGQIKKNFQGSRDRLIIHIQDAHVNEDAQRNIASILDYFAKNYGLKLITLEGAEGRLYPEAFSFFPDQRARRQVADYFLREGRLSGPMYLAVVDRPGLELYGVENGELYEENRRAYLDALTYKRRDEEVLARLGKIVTEISR